MFFGWNHRVFCFLEYERATFINLNLHFFCKCHKKKMFRIYVLYILYILYIYYIYIWWFAYVSTMYLILDDMFATLCVSKRSLSHVSIRVSQWNTLNWLAEAATKNQDILKWKKRYLMLRLGLTQKSHAHRDCAWISGDVHKKIHAAWSFERITCAGFQRLQDIATLMPHKISQKTTIWHAYIRL